MKKNQAQYKRFFDLIIKEVNAKNNSLVNTEKSSQNKKIKLLTMRNMGTLLLTPAIVAGGISCAKNNEPSNKNLPVITTQQSQTIFQPHPFNNSIYTATYNGESYQFLKEDYVLSLASKSLDRVQLMLSAVDGITPVGTTTGEFYPDYFNPYLLTALCYVESSYRIADANGNLLSSSADALGLTQIKPETIDDLNKWLNSTLKIKNLSYSVEDLQNPETAMDITTLILIKFCKNHGKVGCNNPIYTYLHEGFSLERQEEIILALYNNGYGNMQKYIKEGTVYNYLREGKPTNYVNRVLSKKESLQENYSVIE